MGRIGDIYSYTRGRKRHLVGRKREWGERERDRKSERKKKEKKKGAQSY